MGLGVHSFDYRQHCDLLSRPLATHGVIGLQASLHRRNKTMVGRIDRQRRTGTRLAWCRKTVASGHHKTKGVRPERGMWRRAQLGGWGSKWAYTSVVLCHGSFE